MSVSRGAKIYTLVFVRKVFVGIELHDVSADIGILPR